MARIVHLTSVHSSLDPRIFEKECVTLADAGHEVVLIAADRSTPRVANGVAIRVVPHRQGRLMRMVATTYQVFRAALRERGDAYHFHDPELIPWGWLLRLLGRRVTYDVHEDYPSGLLERAYIPRAFRSTVARAADLAERVAARTFHIVLAERYYVRRFPRGTTILNYPTVPDAEAAIPAAAFAPGSRRLLYTGNVTYDRGALNHARLLAVRPDLEMHAIGRCRRDVAEAMREAAGAGASGLRIEGIDTYVPFARIRAAYEEGGWLCGVAVFPASPHYREKELTKFFEYMMVGLPIVASDFPVWRELIDGERVGVCVPPDDPHALASAVDWLLSHPAEAEQMALRGQRLARERFNWRSEGRKLVAFYEAVLA